MLLKSLTSFLFYFFRAFCIVLIFNLTVSLLLFLLVKSEKLYFSSLMKILSKHFYLRYFFGKIFPGREIRNTSTYGLLRISFRRYSEYLHK